jgi:hypothetical protein
MEVGGSRDTSVDGYADRRFGDARLCARGLNFVGYLYIVASIFDDWLAIRPRGSTQSGPLVDVRLHDSKQKT